MTERKARKKSTKIPAVTARLSALVPPTGSRHNGHAAPAGPFSRTTLRARMALLTLVAHQPARVGHP